MDTTLWLMFCLAFFTALVTPGPNVLFAITQSLTFGAKTAMQTVIGFAMGTATHALVVLSGLGLLIKNNLHLMLAIKWLGITYLLWLAYTSFRSHKIASSLTPAATPPTASPSNLTLNALIVSCTNPKGIIASLLTYTAFISPAYAYTSQALALGCSAVVISLSVYAGYVLIADRARAMLLNSINIDKAASLVYLVVALSLVFTT